MDKIAFHAQQNDIRVDLDRALLPELGLSPEMYQIRRLNILTKGISANDVYPIEVYAVGAEEEPRIYWIKRFNSREACIKEISALKKLSQGSDNLSYKAVITDAQKRLIVTEHVPQTIPVSAEWHSFDRDQQLKVLKALGKSLVRLNAAGVYHNDAQAKNFLLPLMVSDEEPEIIPIDFEYSYVDEGEDAIYLRMGREVFIAQQFRAFQESIKITNKISEAEIIAVIGEIVVAYTFADTLSALINKEILVAKLYDAFGVKLH